MNKPVQPKLIILDRDGVVNEDSDDYIKSVEEWIPVPGSIEAICELSKAGYVITIATNQSGIGRGFYHLETLHAMHEKMENLVKSGGGHIQGVYYCPHLPGEGCDCRKPDIGLIRQIEESTGLSAVGAPFVGDSISDIEAAQKAHCQPILVRSGKGERTLKKLVENHGIPVFTNLLAYTQHLLHRS